MPVVGTFKAKFDPAGWQVPSAVFAKVGGAWKAATKVWHKSEGAWTTVWDIVAVDPEVIAPVADEVQFFWVGPVTNSQALLLWQPVDGATLYHVYRAGPIDVEDFVKVVETVGSDYYGGQKGWVDQEFTETGNYAYYVIAVVSGVLSSPSNTVSGNLSNDEI